MDWACGAAHSSATSQEGESSLGFPPVKLNIDNILLLDFFDSGRLFMVLSKIAARQSLFGADTGLSPIYNRAVSQVLVTQMCPL